MDRGDKLIASERRFSALLGITSRGNGNYKRGEHAIRAGA
jgi:hypothetical protein